MKLFPFYNLREFIVIVFVISVIFLLTAMGMGQLGTYVLIPLGFFTLLTKPHKIKFIFKRVLVKYYSLLFVMSSLSIFYAISPEAAISTQSKMAIVFLFCLTIFSFAIESFRNVNLIYYTNALVLLFVYLYVLFLGVKLGDEGRVSDSVLNANTYGYYIFNGLTSLFLLFSSIKLKSTLRVLFFLIIVLFCLFSIWLALISASRSASVIAAILVFGNFFIIFFLKRKGVIKKFFLLLFFVIGVIYSLHYLNDNYFKNSYLSQRFDQLEDLETPREFHLRKAIEIGLDNPIIGVGAGNYAVIPKQIEQGSFSHNSFAEIFANFGITGLLIFFLFLSQVPKKVIKLLHQAKFKEKVVLYHILLYYVVFLIYSVFYVVYLSSTFLHFYFLICANLILIEKKISLETSNYTEF